MLTLKQILLDSFTPILVVIIGLLMYRKLSLFYRILFFQTTIFLILDLYASTFPDNGLVYNISMMIEIGLLFLASHLYFRSFVSKWISFIGYFTFLVLWCFDIFYYDKNRLADHAYIIGGIFITAVYIRILFEHYTKRVDHFRTLPLLLSCLGILVFFAGIVPFLSMMYYLHDKDKDLSKTMFQYMIVYPAVIRYFLLAIALWLLRKNNTISLSNAT